MEYEWYKESDPHTAPLYAGRAVLPYLLVGNVAAANSCYNAFTAALRSDNPSLAVEDVKTSQSGIHVFPSLPLLNFLGLLLLAVQRGAPEVYKGLLSRYATQINENESWAEPIEIIGEMYFNIQRPRQSNGLMDMMSGLFGGGGGGQQQPQRRAAIRPAQQGPVAEGLD